MKHLKQESRDQLKKRKHRLIVLICVLLVATIGAAAAVYLDANARPGVLEKIWISEISDDNITVTWERPRNIYKYVVDCGGKIVVVPGRKSSVKIEGLTEDTLYEVSVRADSRKKEGLEAPKATARTKKSTHITGEDRQIKFANWQTDLKQTAETKIVYLPGNGYKVTEDGEIIFTKPGEITVTAKAEGTAEYASSEKEIRVDVLDTVNVDAKGATPRIFYKLNKDNCDRVKTIKGVKGATIPQSFAYTGSKYIVTYIKGTTQKIIVFGDKKKVYTPKKDLGHANGLTMADGICYSVRGRGSTKCITFDPANKNYKSFDLKYGASGIAYDEASGMFYASSRTRLTAYDKNFNVVNDIGRVKRKNKYYIQDCGAYGGILMQCVSGEDYHGINYIDFYNMTEGKYVGTVECDLSEIESLLVDDEGYIELLTNTKDPKDYIWKTPINMKRLCG